MKNEVKVGDRVHQMTASGNASRFGQVTAVYPCPEGRFATRINIAWDGLGVMETTEFVDDGSLRFPRYQ